MASSIEDFTTMIFAPCKLTDEIINGFLSELRSTLNEKAARDHTLVTYYKVRVSAFCITQTTSRKIEVFMAYKPLLECKKVLHKSDLEI